MNSQNLKFRHSFCDKKIRKMIWHLIWYKISCKNLTFWAHLRKSNSHVLIHIKFLPKIPILFKTFVCKYMRHFENVIYWIWDRFIITTYYKFVICKICGNQKGKVYNFFLHAIRPFRQIWAGDAHDKSGKNGNWLD